MTFFELSNIIISGIASEAIYSLVENDLVMADAQFGECVVIMKCENGKEAFIKRHAYSNISSNAY